MRENGTDRDVALSILSSLSTTATLVASINDTLYAPHITTQPTDYEGAIGSRATFTVVATNVKAYQWYYKYTGIDWTASGATGNKTDTLSLDVTEARLTQEYRCRILGLDGTYIYTNVVKMIEAET